MVILMKKAIAVFLTLILGLSLLTACGGGDGNTAVSKEAGYYVIDTIIMEGEVYDAEDLEEMEIDYFISLGEDGTMLIKTDEYVEGTWKNGVLSYEENGESVINNYTLENGILTLEIADNDITFIFKKQ